MPVSKFMGKGCQQLLQASKYSSMPRKEPFLQGDLVTSDINACQKYAYLSPLTTFFHTAKWRGDVANYAGINSNLIVATISVAILSIT